MLFLARMLFWLFVVAMLMPERGQQSAQAAAEGAREAARHARQAALGACSDALPECLAVAGRALKAGEELAASAGTTLSVPLPVARPARTAVGG